MSVIRSFIAINLSDETKEQLRRVVGQLQNELQDVPIRWVPIENIHLTIKFLGNVSISNLEILQNMIHTEAAHHREFEFSVGELGAFPSTRRPRVLWVGVKAPQDLYDLQRGIENETARLGYARENRKFSPHLTVGRMSRNAGPDDFRKLSSILEHSVVGFLGATHVEHIKLYRSDLRPGGAKYTCLYSAPLAQKD